MASQNMVLMIQLPYLSNTAGWIITEMGRRPWIDYKVLKTQNGISKSVLGEEVLFSTIVYTRLYGVLAVVDVYLILKIIKNYPEAKEDKKIRRRENYGLK